MDEDHQQEGESGSPQKPRNDSESMRRQSPEGSAESRRPCATIVIVAFIRPLAQSGMARWLATQSSEADIVHPIPPSAATDCGRCVS